MITEIYIASLSSYPADYLRQEYEKIKEHFVSVDGGKLYKRDENILGRLLLHNALQKHSIEEYTVEYKANEKPSLVSESEMYFNISHSGNYVALALSEMEVGCDIQEIRPYNPKVAKRNYSQKETEFIEKSHNKDESFIRFWALKESVLKFTGMGISGGLSNYDFSPYATEEKFRAFGCNFYVQKTENLYFALCHKAEEFKIENTDFQNERRTT